MPTTADIRHGNSCAGLRDKDFAELVHIAKLDARARTLFIRSTEKLGSLASKALPIVVKTGIGKAIAPALTAANFAASLTHAEGGHKWMASISKRLSGPTFHRLAAGASGAAGGSLGFATAVGDVALCTTLIMRSVQEIAGGYGANWTDPATRADCLSVLAMGGPRPDDDELDSAFWEMRAGLKGSITEVSVNKAIEKGLKTEVAKRTLATNAMTNLLESAAYQRLLERFGINTQALFVQKAVPMLGGVAGAISNYQFMSYYQKMAHVLFRLRAVEGRYEEGQVLSCYLRVSAAMPKDPNRFD